MSAWQTAYAQAITDPAELLNRLALNLTEWLPAAQQAAQLFSLRVPLGYLAKMEKGNPDDPLLRQVLPLVQELDTTTGYSTDPLQEAAHNPATGLLHKYAGRALLIATGACAIHCRYCFRRHFNYAQQQEPDWEQLQAYFIHHQLDEIILSGGDPLSLSHSRLTRLWQRLQTFPTLRRVRLHTRLPVVLPERLDTELLDLFVQSPWPIILVLHTNHPQELGPDITRALAPLRSLPITLLNQTVLLKGVNDNIDTLVALSQTLFYAGILPYYLHTLDKVQGAAHFAIPDSQAQHLFRQMQAKLPGYLVPRLVREIPTAQMKTLML